MERSGYQEGAANDQGLVFFLPNMTWGQPAFYVRKLYAETWQPFGLNTSATSGGLWWHAYLRRAGGYEHRRGYFGGGGDIGAPELLTPTACAAACAARPACAAYFFAAPAAAAPPPADPIWCRLASLAAPFTAFATRSPQGALSAQMSSDRRTVVARYVNQRDDAVALTVTLRELRGLVVRTAKAWSYHSTRLSAVNTPAQPTAIIPVGPSPVNTTPAGVTGIAVPARALAVIEFALS